MSRMRHPVARSRYTAKSAERTHRTRLAVHAYPVSHSTESKMWVLPVRVAA